MRVAVEHTPLEELELERVRLNVDADVDSLALLTTCRGQLKSLCLSSARLGGGLHALCPIVSTCASLRQLRVEGDNTSCFLPADAEPEALLQALRRSQLASLALTGARLRDAGPHMAALFHSLEGHATLRTLDLSGNELDNDEARAQAGGHIASLIRSRTLTSLNISGWSLRDAGLHPVLAALAGDCTLRELGMLGELAHICACERHLTSRGSCGSHTAPSGSAGRLLRVETGGSLRLPVTPGQDETFSSLLDYPLLVH